MPTHRKASVAQSHLGRKPRWEIAGYLLVKEGTISWAPWTKPMLGCISHLHTTNLAIAVQTPLQGWLYPLPHTGSVLQSWLGEHRSLGWSFFLPLELTGPLQVWSHLCAFISLVQTETRPFFSTKMHFWGTVMLADLWKAEAVDAVSLPVPFGSMGTASNALPPLEHWASKP